VTFGAPIAFRAKQVKYVWNEIEEVFDKVVTTFGDPLLAGIQFEGTDAAPSFRNVTPRLGKFMTILQVSTRHEHVLKIECDGKQGYWPRDTWTQPTDITFNTPGGATELSMPISIDTVTSVARVHQPLSHVSFVDVCELDEDEVREFEITTNDLEFDYEFIVFRMLPDGLNVDSVIANRVDMPFSGAGVEWSISIVDDPVEWFNYRQRWRRFTSVSASRLVATVILDVLWNQLVRSQFSHNMTLKFRRSNAIPLPTSSYAIIVEVRSFSGAILYETFSVDVLSTGEVETRTMSLPINQSDLQIRFDVPAGARFEYQVYTERTYAP
jgi:hypothetical protein